MIADRDDHIVQVGVSSIISMTIGLLALAACVVLVLVLIRCVSYNTYYRLDKVKMTSFAITLYGQYCLRHVVGQQVVSDVSVVCSC